MLQSINADAQVALHLCGACGHQRTVPIAQIQVTAENIIIGPCPTCQAQLGVTTTEHFRRDLTRADTGEIQHPQSLAGTVMPDTGGVVVEDSRFESPPHHKRQALLIRALMAALNLPLASDPQVKHG
jgi:sulfur relay (sulfurtransferase) complex TusBCD TusD component (DsrE family)